MRNNDQIIDVLVSIAAGETSARETMALVALFAHESGEVSPRHSKGISAYASDALSRLTRAKTALEAELAIHDVRFAADLASVAWGSDPRSLWALLLDRFGARPHVWEAALMACGDDSEDYQKSVRLAARRAVFAYLAGALVNCADIEQILNIAIEQAMCRDALHVINEQELMFDNVRVTVSAEAIRIWGTDGEVKMDIEVILDGPEHQPALCTGHSFDSGEARHIVANALAEEGFISAANMVRYL